MYILWLDTETFILISTGDFSIATSPLIISPVTLKTTGPSLRPLRVSQSFQTQIDRVILIAPRDITLVINHMTWESNFKGREISLNKIHGYGYGCESKLGQWNNFKIFYGIEILPSLSPAEHYPYISYLVKIYK